MTNPHRPGHSTALPAILLAVQGFDTGRIVDVLDAEADRQGLDSVVDDVIFPALRTVGTYWAHGSFNVSHEHLFTAAATRWLHARTTARSSPATADRRGRRGYDRPVILASGPDDLHVIGLDCLELLLTTRGVGVCNLGARVPTEALVATASTLDAAAVVVYSHAEPEAGRATSAAASLRAVHAAGLRVYYAGSSFDSPFLHRRMPGVALNYSVAVSADVLAQLGGGPVDDDTASALSYRAHPSG